MGHCACSVWLELVNFRMIYEHSNIHFNSLSSMILNKSLNSTFQVWVRLCIKQGTCYSHFNWALSYFCIWNALAFMETCTRVQFRLRVIVEATLRRDQETCLVESAGKVARCLPASLTKFLHTAKSSLEDLFSVLLAEICISVQYTS